MSDAPLGSGDPHTGRTGRYVILLHDHPFVHWDFMLEHGAALRTWRILQSPDTPGSIEAEPLPDHRLAYLDYEGPVSGNRGSVTRWDWGEYKVVENAPERVSIRLTGIRLNGSATLSRGVDGTRWDFCRSAM